MKVFKKLVALATTAVVIAACLAVFVPAKAEAAETPTKWYVTYDSGSGRWYGSNDGVNWANDDLTGFKAGDTLVVNADNATPVQYEIRVPAAVGELAIIKGANVVIYASYVDHVYVVGQSVGVINANVNKAEAYTTGVLQINGDVNEFTAYYESGQDPNFAVSGTVGKANVKWTGDVLSNKTTIYNVAKGKLYPDQYSKIVVLEKGKDCSTDPSAQTYPVTSGAAAAAKAATSEKQLDKVPKTGFFEALPESILFFGLAAVFAIGAVCYRKKLGR